MRVLIAYDMDEYEEILEREASGEVISVEDAEIPGNLPEELQECVESLEKTGYWRTLWSLNKFLKSQPPVRIAYMVKLYMQYKDIEAAMKTARQATFIARNDKLFEFDGKVFSVTTD
jgi:hypothetical protein